MPSQTYSWSDIAQALRNYMGADYPTIMNTLDRAQLNYGDIETVNRLMPDAKVTYYKDGRYFAHLDPVLTDAKPNAGTAINSNTAIVQRGKVSLPVATTTDTSGKLSFSQLASKYGSRGVVVGASVGTAAALVGTGTALGQVVSPALYQAFPNFWETMGVAPESFDPSTWSSITYGQEGLGVDLINFLLDIDPDTGAAQAYMSGDAFAYMAAVLAANGIFSPGYSYDDTSIFNYYGTEWTMPVYAFSPGDVVLESQYYRYTYSANSDNVVCIPMAPNPATSSNISYQWYSTTSGAILTESVLNKSTGTVNTRNTSISRTQTFAGVTMYNTGSVTSRTFVPSVQVNAAARPDFDAVEMAYTVFHGTKSAVEGITQLPGGVYPNPAQLATVPDALAYLPQLLPDVFANPISWPSVDPTTGEQTEKLFYPIPLPNMQNLLDPEPTTGTQTQTDPEYRPDPEALPDPQTTADLTQGKTTPDTPEPPNPPDTGTGSTPVAPVPTGSASALWSIYNPTQAQVDALGAWLWSPNFVDQILKIFNNPMESIIGLHKVFAAPAVGGAQNIKVGYLDSGVSSNVVTSQYSTVDCGSVNLYEYFGSVFDYSPYTDVKLYLPFVGIVPLDVADVMRSTLGVVYHVDVLTGACLAEVTVTRDGGGGTLYQYAGDAAVQYPISSGSYMGIVAGIAGAVGSIAATAATGGGALPMILGGGGSLAGMHTTVQNSGGFGGNAGAMGAKKPYLIVSRPQTKVAADYPHMQGYPTNHTARVGECSGYIRAAEVRELDVPATSVELAEIADWLQEGVIL